MASALPELPTRYRVVRRLGTGGSSEVLLVEDRGGTPPRKAMKILGRDIAPVLLAAFRDEFRILASLEHPGLARVFDFGQLQDGRPFYTAELVEGRELGRRGSGLRETCLAVAVVTRTLAFLHARGFLHNDVKPSNIVVPGQPDAARLLDLGLSAIERSGASGRVAGTPGYIAPERLEGRAWDERADLYAVGATLYRVLGGKRVVETERPEDALRGLLAGWRSLRELRPDVPEGVSDLVDRLLALDPAGRPRRAAEVVLAIGAAIGESIPLETPGTARCYALASVLAGRRAELDRLESALRHAESARVPRLLAVAGPAGAGKSRLWRELGWRAEMAGFRVAAIDGRAVEDAEQAFGRIAEQLGAAAPGTAGAPAGEFLAALPPVPVLIVVDQAHEAPDALWRAVAALHQGALAANRPLALLAAFDPEGLDAVARQVVTFGGPAWTRIDLGPLSGEDVRGLFGSLFGPGAIPAEIEEEIAGRCGGSPLLLEEIVREMVETGRIHSTAGGWAVGAARGDATGSHRLEDFLRRRSSGLSSDAGGALVALSVLGGAAPSQVAAGVAGPGIDVRLGLSELAGRALLVIGGDGARLVHETLARLTIEKLEPGRRAEWYRVALPALRAAGADAARLARAHLEAADAPGALDEAEPAALRAAAAGEVRRAVALFELALDAAERCGAESARKATLLAGLADALQGAGRNADSLAAIDRAAALLPADALPERLRLASVASRVAFFTGSPEVLEARLPVADGPPPDAAVAARAEHLAAYAFYLRHRYRAARARLESALALLDGVAARPDVLVLRAYVLAMLTDVEEQFDRARSEERARQALAAAELTGNQRMVEATRNNVANHDAVVKGPDEAAETLRAAALAHERAGIVDNLGIVLANLAQVEYLRGDRVAARTALDRGGALAAAAGSAFETALSRTAEVFNAWWENDPARVATHVGSALGHPGVYAQLLVLGAWAAAELRSLADVEDFARRAEEESRAGETPLCDALATAARAFARCLADPAAGAALIEEAADALTAIGHGPTMLPLRRDAARWFLRARDADTARRALDRARAALGATRYHPSALQLDDIERLIRAGHEPTASARVGQIDRLLHRIRDRVERAYAGADETRLGRLRTEEPRLLVAIDRALAGDRSGGEPTTLLTPSPTRAETPSAIRSGTPGARLLDLTIGPVEITAAPSELRRAFPEIVGRSAGMLQAFTLLDRLARSDVPVLLSGETGTGKEVFARALHAAGSRAAKPFVVVNCPAIPDALFESQLFGHRRGAFTGASTDHPGLARQAEGGTLFLDEVSELPRTAQPKLLRLLQERRIRPLGAKTEEAVDFRLVCATNRDLARHVAAGRFREDLYYRINVVELALPPLRARASDIPEIARTLLARHGRAGQAISPSAERRLINYSWPGNVRELENEIRRASVLARDGAIHERHLSEHLRAAGGTVPVGGQGSLAERMAPYEREVLRNVLAESKGNRSHAARILGLSRYGLRLKLQRLGLAPPRRRARRTPTRSGSRPRSRAT